MHCRPVAAYRAGYRGRSRNFKRGGVQRNFLQKGGGGGNHLLGAICIANKQNLLKKGGGGGGPDPLDLPPSTAMAVPHLCGT